MKLMARSSFGRSSGPLEEWLLFIHRTFCAFGAPLRVHMLRYSQ